MSKPYNDVWVAVQELGAAIDALNGPWDVPRGLQGLSRALGEAKAFIEQKAVEEEEAGAEGKGDPPHA